MRYLPVEVDVADREALVVGASADVVSKIDRLLDAGARVLVVSAGPCDPGVEERARAHAEDGRVRLVKRDVEDADLDGKAIVFFATSEDTRAAPFHARAVREGRLLCTIDRPEVSTFVNPAVAQAQGLTMTFATGGVSPGAVRRIREDLESIFGDPRFGRFLDALRALREKLPRGARAEAMAKAVSGFGLSGALRFPAWLDRGEDPPT